MTDKKYIHYKHDICVAEYDADFKGCLKPGAVMSYFQDAATAHALIMGYGYDVMRSKNLAWVVVRMSIKVLRNPYAGESLSIITFPERPRAADVDRGYYILDKSGEPVILGTSKWCVIDVNTHKIQRCTPLFAHVDTQLLTPEPPFTDGNPKIEALSGSDTAQERFQYSVRLTDLDRNIHMNNARYGDVILNVCGMDALREHSIARIDINFMSELFYDDSFEVCKSQKGDVTCIESIKTTGAENSVSNTVFRARVQWRKNDA